MTNYFIRNVKIGISFGSNNNKEIDNWDSEVHHILEYMYIQNKNENATLLLMVKMAKRLFFISISFL